MAKTKILVVGPGALGVSTTVLLAKAGHDVTMAARSEDSASRLNSQGLRLSDPSGKSEVVKVSVISSPQELDAQIDLFILATKVYAALPSMDKWIKVLSEDGIFMPYQNGLLGDEFAKTCGERLVECAVYYGATLVERGHSQMTGPGHLHIGPWPHGPIGPSTRTARAAAILSAVVPTYTYEDMFSVKWNKLLFNAAATSLGVISGLNMAGMMEHTSVRSSFLDIVSESHAIAMAAGAKSMSLGGINAGMVIRLPRFIAHMGMRFATRRNRQYKSSSQQSLDRGEPTEVDFLNGRIVSEASRLGMPSPWNQAVVKAVHEVEAEPRSAGLGKIEKLREMAVGTR